ncbi:MAG TPA: GNAT family N-acetyltransferase [Saprospiraceae bacterium]|nr:GNAT family N-acetyltransferase [Saprospiraceae bacterium]
MKQIFIRKASIDDAEIIALLARVTFTETFAAHFRDRQDLKNYYGTTFSVSKIRSSIAKTNNVFWIAFCEDLPVGYAKLKLFSKSEFIDSDSVSQLQKIYVLSDFLNMKIGQRLQEAIFEETQKFTRKYIWLSVLKSNERAIHFY